MLDMDKTPLIKSLLKHLVIDYYGEALLYMNEQQIKHKSDQMIEQAKQKSTINFLR